METNSMTTTSEVSLSDNSNIPENVVVDNDLSKDKLPAPVKVNFEPEINKTEAVSDTAEQAEVMSETKADENLEVPEKFRNKDGSVRLPELLKSYKQLEPLMGVAAELGKFSKGLAEQSQINSLNSLNGLQGNSELANREIAVYAKYLDFAKNPEEVKALFETYAKNPTRALLNKIEDNFSGSTIMQMANELTVARLQSGIAQREEMSRKQQAETQAFLNDCQATYTNYFKNPEFCNLFGAAFNTFGTNLDVSFMINALDKYVDSVLAEKQYTDGKSQHNNAVTSELSAMKPSSLPGASDDLPPVNLLEITDKELLKKYIRKYYKNKK